jgi:two-component system response regulator HydG
VLPPLRERREDIPRSSSTSSRSTRKKMRRSARLGEGVIDYLERYDFPGNIRELENLIEQGVALALDGEVQLDDIVPPEMRQGGEPRQPRRCCTDVVDRAEREAIMNVLREVDGNKEKAAEVLGLSSTTLWRKMKRSRSVSRGP